MAKSAAALHILLKDIDSAKMVLQKLEKGANFQDLAKKYSTCPSKKKGGDLGEFRRGQMSAAFDKAVFSCPLLTPFGPIKTPFGYHIIKVLWRN